MWNVVPFGIEPTNLRTAQDENREIRVNASLSNTGEVINDFTSIKLETNFITGEDGSEEEQKSHI